MKLRVTKEHLQSRLSDVQNIVERKASTPILGHVLLDVKRTGSRITATDLETSLREPLEAEVEEEGVLCVPARKLFEIVREVDGDLSLEEQAANRLKVHAGQSVFKLSCLAAAEFPSWPALESSFDISMDAPVLAAMIESTVYAAGTGKTKHTLNGLLFHLERNALTLVGTDGHRMAVNRKEVPQDSMEKQKVIVPRKLALELRKFLGGDGQVFVSFGTNHIRFEAGEVEIMARLIAGTYPGYAGIIPKNNAVKLDIRREEFIRALRRVSLMSSSVRFELKSGAVRFTAEDKEMGEALEDIAVEYEGEGFKAGFNSRYLLDALGALRAENVAFELQDALSATLLRARDDEDYRCVIMPQRT